MKDPFKNLSDVMEMVGGSLQYIRGGQVHEVQAPEDHLNLRLSGCAALGQAMDGEISFFANSKYREQLDNAKASVVLINAQEASHFWNRVIGKSDEQQLPYLLVCKDPYFAFREVMVLLHGFRERPGPGLSEKAFISPDAKIGEGVTVMAGAYVDAEVSIGGGTVIYPGVFLGQGVAIGEQSIIYPNVCIYDHCEIGKRVIIHACAVIGEDGFGFATHQKENEVMAHHKIPQIGDVVIGDDVEIGACAIIDRAALETTRVGKGSKVSNLVTVGHGATIGRHNLIVAQCGIAGSTKVGDYVVMGGQCGVGGHLKIAAGSQFAARSAIDRDINEKGRYGGVPVLPLKQMWRVISKLHKLPELFKQVKELSEKVETLETSSERT